MRVLVVEPERRPKVREIDDSLKAMQEIVGGYIQPIYPFDDPIALVCNDEGRLMNLPANPLTAFLRQKEAAGSTVLYDLSKNPRADTLDFKFLDESPGEPWPAW